MASRTSTASTRGRPRSEAVQELAVDADAKITHGTTEIELAEQDVVVAEITVQAAAFNKEPEKAAGTNKDITVFSK